MALTQVNPAMLSGSSNTTTTIQSNGTTAITIDATQKVGIGTSSPAYPLDVLGVVNARSATAANIQLYSTNASDQQNTIGSYANSGAAFSQLNHSASFYTWGTSGTERMRIDSSGNLLVGQTTSGTANSNSLELGSLGRIVVNHANGTGSGTYYEAFAYNAGVIGSITQSGTTAVLYNTTSDYRLKSDVTPITNALDTVKALNPVSFTWIDGRKDDGFIAHELQEILPNCVTGEKDAVNEDGTPKYQQMDNSGVIPFLVKAIQELKAEVDALKGVK